MLAPAVFGINNDALNTAVEVLILFLIVIYAALIFWTYADARRRIDDPMLIACATAASLFPFVGTIVYMIVRPPEFLDDVYLRNLEIQASEEKLRHLEIQTRRLEVEERRLDEERRLLAQQTRELSGRERDEYAVGQGSRSRRAAQATQQPEPQPQPRRRGR